MTKNDNIKTTAFYSYVSCITKRKYLNKKYILDLCILAR